MVWNWMGPMLVWCQSRFYHCPRMVITFSLACRMVRPEDEVEFLASDDDETDSEYGGEDDPDSNGVWDELRLKHILISML